MRVKIEEYRGWDLSFDTDRQVFFALSDAYDTQKEKNSYAAVKKAIDEYINENLDFKPIVVQRGAGHYNQGELITLVGIRKDGTFMAKWKEDKLPKQLSGREESSYSALNPDNDSVWSEIQSIEEQINALEKKKKAIIARFVPGESLADIKKRYGR